MITVKVFLDSDGQYRGFQVKGHAGFADSGKDIICAAVSVLTQNAVNSIEAFTEDTFTCSVEDGYLDCTFTGAVSERSKLLLNSMMLGIESVMEDCETENDEDQFIRILTEEV